MARREGSNNGLANDLRANAETSDWVEKIAFDSFLRWLQVPALEYNQRHHVAESLMRILLALLVAVALIPTAIGAEPDTYFVGVARVDITPNYPIRLNGFGFRRAESEGVTQRIWAKALAIGTDEEGPAVLIAVDNLGISAAIREEVAARLAKKTKLDPKRLAITASHTHTAPMLVKNNPTLFGVPIPDEHLKHIDQYTKEFTDKLEQVALAALNDRQPARMSWGVGKVGFAANRRTKGGPVDHDLPTLVVRDLQGKIRAIYVSYACHCVTLSSNKISGDWAGYAQEAIQDAFPGVTALVSIGCGADQNPNSGVTGDKSEMASRQGMEIAAEVKRLVNGFLAPVTGKLAIDEREIELPLAPLPDRTGWEERAKKTDAIGYHARVQLAKLDRGEAIRTRIDYPIRTWAFGDSLAMVFLPGEVVVDYSLRLKRELDSSRLWINAYANDAPCYIPSERVLKEGGYEGGGAMIYYDVPAAFKAGLEQPIIDAVKAQIGKTFVTTIDTKKTANSLPPSAQQAAAAIRTKPDLTVELMASEPLVASPVAIDFGPDHRLWVAEMYDYPLGLDGKFKPGGRVRMLDYRDGKFVSSKIFLDNIPFPTGILVWRKGVLICAAPDIIYAEDTDGDGKADVVKKLYSGFGTGNYQGRVNSLQYGLDGWVYGSCGLFGGNIKSFAFPGELMELGDRDFRIKPDTGEIEPATGRTQQGRVRDDWGNWFGCNNSQLCLHYPLAHHYLRRNPYVTAPEAAVVVNDYPNANQLFPIGQQQLFKLSGPAGRTTAACGIGIYRDDLLGKQYTGNVFTCEPSNMLVHRLVLTPRGSTFSGRRAPDEQSSEFLASPDGWCRPVQIVTGPDGCLWVVDMCRYVIEHPRWIPPEDVAKLDVRAGFDRGRIYRLRPSDKEPRPWLRLDKLDTAGLVNALDSANGWQRDMAMQMLVWKGDKGAAAGLEKMVKEGKRPEARLQAVCSLDGIKEISSETRIRWYLGERDSGVRRHMVRLLESDQKELQSLYQWQEPERDRQLQLQLTCSCGELQDVDGGLELLRMTILFHDDPYMVAAAFSGLRGKTIQRALEYFFERSRDPLAKSFPHAYRAIVLATALMEQTDLIEMLRGMIPDKNETVGEKHITLVAGVLDGLEQKQLSLSSLKDGDLSARIGKVVVFARDAMTRDKTSEAERLSAIRLLGRDPEHRDEDAGALAKLIGPAQSPALQTAALTSLGRIGTDKVATSLISGWRGLSPAIQSQVLDLLLSRPAWKSQLLKSIEGNAIPAGQIDAARRQRLLGVKDEALRKRAEKVFAATSSDRVKVMESYREALSLKGDVARGKEVFAKRCAACHQLNGVGYAVGPDLAGLANKSPQYLLQEILDPNRNVDSRYIAYVAQTKAGRSFDGLLASESAASITLKGQDGKQQVLLRSEIEELTSSGKSLMPEGLEKDIAKQDMADLFAYLGEQRTPPKQVAGNSPSVVKLEGGKLLLLATNCEIHGGEIMFESEFKNIGNWHGEKDHVIWTVELDKGGEFDVILDYACDNRSAGSAWILEGAKAPLRGKVAGTGGWDKYKQGKVGTVSLEAGRRQIILRPDGVKPNPALMDLRGVQLIPAERR
jgi:putative membrane-bound dehydrogenase-like protein